MSDNYTSILGGPISMLAAFELAGEPAATLSQKVMIGVVALSTLGADPVAGSTGRAKSGSSAIIGVGSSGTISL